MRSVIFSLGLTAILPAAVLCLSESSLTKFPNTLKLESTFDPIIPAYWTGLPHHRRTPFSVSPDGQSAYLAYLDTTYNTVFVQQVNTTTFTSVGTAIQIDGAREAGGLVAQNDGFALLTNIIPDASTADAPPDGYPIAQIIRYVDGALAWTTAVNGPGVHAADGLSATPDINGDLVYSEKAGLYAAYFVVTAYTGYAAGHFGDSVMYVDDAGALVDVDGTSVWGCSHNTGIALEEAEEAPFASVCAEDHGAIWLNTETRGMGGVKIANENTTNGVSGEPMGGMSGSYSSLSLFPTTTSYIFAWATRGAVNLQLDTWLGTGFTTCSPRTLNHNVAIALTTTKSKLLNSPASSVVGAASGDDQLTLLTNSTTTDHQNIHAAAFDADNALVTWEALENPDCKPVPLGCTGTFAGTWFQQVDRQGAKVGEAVAVEDVMVAGDIVNVGGRLCWPYVSMEWDLSKPKANGTYVGAMSFACVGMDGSTEEVVETTAAAAVPSTVTLVVEVPSSTGDAMVSETEASVVVTSTAVAEPTTASVVLTTTAIAEPTTVGPTTSEIEASAVPTSSTRSFQFVTTAVEPTTTSETETAVETSETAVETSTTSEAVETTSSSRAELTSAALPTRSFRNIVTISDTATITDIETSTVATEEPTATSSEVVVTTTEEPVTTTAATTEAPVYTDEPTATSTEEPATTEVTTATETETSTVEVTSTEAPTASATTDVTTTTEAETSTAEATSTEAPISTETPATTATRSFKNIISLTAIPTATETATETDAPASTAAGSWHSCADGTECAAGHRCVSFRGGVAICVPKRTGGARARGGRGGGN